MLLVALSLTAAVIVTVLGVIYLLTIGRLTDVIPILGFADDAVVVFLIVFAWASVVISTLMESVLASVSGILSPVALAFLVAVLLFVLELKTRFVSGLFGKK